MFYEDQHKLAAYLERNPDAEWGYKDFCVWRQGGTLNTVLTPSKVVATGHTIRPVLRYGLPSHLQSEIHNPDNLTEEQICEGGKYRACVKQDRCDQPRQMFYGESWIDEPPASCIVTFSDMDCQYRLPADVPWPDWEREEAAQPDPKDARIAELEKQISELHESCENLRKNNNYPVSPWRRMSEVPTEEDADAEGCVFVMNDDGLILVWKIEYWKTHASVKHMRAWMRVPKFHGWPDPLADLLKSHGIEATPELTAALTAWKGVEK